MKRILHSLFLICSLYNVYAQNANQTNQPSPLSGTVEYKVGVAHASSLYSNMEKFEFVLNGGEKIELNSNNPIVYFTQKITSGQTYSISQVSGPRACNFVGANAGTITNSDVLVLANCGYPPLTMFKLNVTGIGTGEVFSFSDNYRRTSRLSFSTLLSLGSYPSGDHYIITQTGGPRQCIIAPASGTVPNGPLTIQCDCTKKTETVSPPSNGKLNGTFTAPPGTKIELQLNNTDVLGLTEPANASNTWMQTMNFNFPKTYPAGMEYSIRIKSSPQNLTCAVYENGTGTTPQSSGILKVGCDYTYDHVSRSSDNKILGTYYESVTPVIGGKGNDEGRYVAFVSSAVGLAGSKGKYRQIFWRDRVSGITKLISIAANGEEGNENSYAPAISADGKTVAFESYATNLAQGDNNSARDVYLWDEQTGKVILISKTQSGICGNSESFDPSVSGDGSFISFSSGASNLTPNVDGTSTINVYVHHVASGLSDLISKDFKTRKGVGGAASSISEDGTKIAFCSSAYTLVENDNNNLWDIFLFQASQPGLKRISLTSAGGERNQGTESYSRVVAPSISGDGNYIAYATTASNMVPGDNNNMQDIFLYNISSGAVKRVSAANNNEDSNGDSPINQGDRIGISYDGKWISYNTTATNLGVLKGNIVMQNTLTGKITPVTNTNGGSTGRPMISGNGRYIVAGCSEKYDKRFSSSGIFAFHTGNSINL